MERSFGAALFVLLPCTLLLASVWTAAGQAATPYAGQQQREIKALSPDEVRAYLEGDGMGLALAAELNHYPGPRHVLDLAADLDLSPDQHTAVQAIFAEMRADARALGERIVTAEAALDRIFATASVDEPRLDEAVAEIAELQGRLRLTHLAAHLAVRRLLTADQVERYDRLRGYQERHGAEHRHSH